MVLDFKCPQCGGGMEYDSELGKLQCRSCGFEQAVEDAPEIEEDDSVSVEPFDGGSIPDEAEFSNETEEKETSLYGEEQEFFCNSCGAAIVTEPEVSATHCPYCGSAVAFGERLQGKLAPDKVIPFTVSKEEAKAGFRKWAKNGLLTPKDFMTEKRLGEITGIYVPFWLYDMHVNAEADCSCTKKRSFRRGDYIIHETKHYHVYRRANLNYKKVPADASVKLDDTMMDLLEPYDYRRLRKFEPGYLAGFQAEKYGVDADGLLMRIKNRVSEYAQSYIKSTIKGYSTTTYNSQNIMEEKQQEYYTLLPVWLLKYEYKGESKIYAMNGQTGKVVGKPPISGARVAKWISILYGGSFAVLTLLSYFMV
ncbi:MAG: hypothetical protein IKB07_10030 [Lachnospiraceae bacterium]|nr:hypothetical protein [Lachnospiraceae bacterium]